MAGKRKKPSPGEEDAPGLGHPGMWDLSWWKDEKGLLSKGAVILAIGVLPFKPLGSVPLIAWGVGPGGEARTVEFPGTEVEEPCRESAKKIVCRAIDNFFDILEEAEKQWTSRSIPGLKSF